MGEPSDKIVPIRPELLIEEGRIRALLDHVVEVLVTFEQDFDGEKPHDIAFVVIGDKGTARAAYVIQERASSNLAWAALVLQNLALNDE